MASFKSIIIMLIKAFKFLIYRLRKFIPIVVVIFAVFLFYLCGGFSLLNLKNITDVRKDLLIFVDNYPIYSVLIFVGVYSIYTFTSIPGLLILDLIAGLLFAQPYSTLMVILSCTIGGVSLFLSSRCAFGDFIAKSKSKIINKINNGFQKYRTSYLLFLRLVPFFPFGAVNIALSFLKIPLRTFIWTTAIGMLPISFICTQLGSGLGDVLEQGGAIEINSMFDRTIVFSLIAMSLIALLPILFKKKNVE